jgi:hypothetical protein
LQNFSTSTVAILFLYEFHDHVNDVKNNRKNNGDKQVGKNGEKNIFVQSLIENCEKNLKKIIYSGFSTVIISTSVWTKKNINPIVFL